MPSHGLLYSYPHEPHAASLQPGSHTDVAHWISPSPASKAPRLFSVQLGFHRNHRLWPAGPATCASSSTVRGLSHGMYKLRQFGREAGGCLCAYRPLLLCNISRIPLALVAGGSWELYFKCVTSSSWSSGSLVTLACPFFPRTSSLLAWHLTA